MKKWPWLWVSLAVVLCGAVVWYMEHARWRMDLDDMPTQLVNGGFENEDDESWTRFSGTSSLAELGGRDKPGCLILHLAPTEQPPEPGALVHALPMASQAVRVEDASLIRVGCWIRSTTSTAVGRLFIECRSPYIESEDPYYNDLVEIWGPPVLSVGEWCRTELTVRVPKDTGYVLIGCEALGSDGDVAFDDFSLESGR